MNSPQNPGNQDQSNDKKDASELTTPQNIAALKECIETKILLYKAKRSVNKRLAIIARSLIVLFSFGTTVAIGLKLDPKSIEENIIKINIALIFSTLVTAISSLEKFFDYKPLWTGYNISIAGLNSLLAELEYLSSSKMENITKQEVDDLFKKFLTICENLDRNYNEIRSARDE